MQYRGVEYDVKMGAGRDVWVWTVHTPNPQRGVVTGSRAMAIRDAEKVIKQWCYQHPHAADAAPSMTLSQSTAGQTYFWQDRIDRYQGWLPAQRAG
jgi:hypothetical protein